MMFGESSVFGGSGGLWSMVVFGGGGIWKGFNSVFYYSYIYILIVLINTIEI